MDVNKMKNEYLDYIHQNTQFNQKTIDRVEIVTPFVDSFGEGIYFYIEQQNNKYLVTDQGFTLWSLSAFGVNLLKKQTSRHSLLNSLLQYSGFSLNKEDICKLVSYRDLPQAIHDMTQLLLNIYDFAMFGKNQTVNYFLDDVKSYFYEHRQQYSFFEDFYLTGKSNLKHKVDFVFLNKGQRNLVKVHNQLDKQQVSNILVSWLDTSEKRQAEYGDSEKLSVILSSTGYSKASENNIDALHEYDIAVLNFDDKKQLEKTLAI